MRKSYFVLVYVSEGRVYPISEGRPTAYETWDEADAERKRLKEGRDWEPQIVLAQIETSSDAGGAS